MRSVASRWPRGLAILYIGLVAVSGALYWLGADSAGTWAVTLALPWSIMAVFLGFRFAAPLGGVVAAVIFLGGVGINAWGVYALAGRLIGRSRRASVRARTDATS